MPDSNFNIIIPKWSLPNEIIPISVSWSFMFPWESIEIRLDPHLALKNVSNVQKFSFDNSGNVLNIYKLFQSNLEESQSDYFVLEISAPMIDELNKQFPIEIFFIGSDGNNIKKIDYLRVFRPYLELFTIPKLKIELSESKKKGLIPFGIKIAGFGDIFYSIESVTQGVIGFSPHLMEGNLILYFLYYLKDNDEEIAEDDSDIQNRNDKDGISKIKKKNSIEIEESFIEIIINQVKSLISDPTSIHFDECSDDEVQDLAEYAKKCESTLFLKFNNFLNEFLTETKKQFPFETVETNTTEITITNTEILTQVNKLEINATYFDGMNNEYKSNTIQIPIVDLRKDKTKFPKLTLSLDPNQLKQNQIKGVEHYKFI